MKRSTLLLLAFWAIMLGFGLIELLNESVSNNEAYIAISSILTMFIILVWFVEDAREINHTPSLLLKLGVVFLCFISVPYYLIRYKGWKRSLRSFITFLGCPKICKSHLFVQCCALKFGNCQLPVLQLPNLDLSIYLLDITVVILGQLLWLLASVQGCIVVKQMWCFECMHHLISTEESMNRCGQCRQFTRISENQKDLCGAWEQPTSATREACGFFIPKKPPRQSHATMSQGSQPICLIYIFYSCSNQVLDNGHFVS